MEQLPGSSNSLRAPAIGEQAAMADAVGYAGQHVDEEAADELVDGERHPLDLLALLGAIVLPFESARAAVRANRLINPIAHCALLFCARIVA